jgi:glycosyltransferase involved in cell wall biosynthesis
VGCVPPTPTGPADFVAHLLPYLSRYADLDLFTDQPGSVPAGITGFAGVHHVDERAAHACDLIIYHIANNEYQAPSIDAALAGPPGLLTLHDVSQHHLVEYRFLGHGQAEKYRSVLRAAHGTAGAVLADLRPFTPALEAERFLFDCLRPLLRRHRGAVVHSTFAAETVARREQDLPLFVMPHFAMPAPPPLSRGELGLDESKLVIGHFGYVTRPKRPFLILRAFARLRNDGVPAQLVFGGRAEEETEREMMREIDRLGLQDHVRITGYLTEEQMNGLLQASDIIVSFRWPQVGESSGTVAQALAAGRPLIVQRMGSWAELPTDVVMDVPVADNDIEEAGLHRALARLVDPSARKALGDAAKRFAETELSADLYAQRLIAAASDVVEHHPEPPCAIRASRWRGVRTSAARYDVLRELPPAGESERLLAVDLPDELIATISTIWGYEVVSTASIRGSLPFPAGHFRVVTWFIPTAEPGEHTLEMCSEFNRVLYGQGLILLIHSGDGWLWGEQLETLLRVAGFLPDSTDPLHTDFNRDVQGIDRAERDQLRSIRARKLSLPGLPQELGSLQSVAALGLPQLSSE